MARTKFSARKGGALPRAVIKKLKHVEREKIKKDMEGKRKEKKAKKDNAKEAKEAKRKKKKAARNSKVL